MSTSALTRDAMALKAERGEYTGGQAPYGWRPGDGGMLVEDAAEQRTIGLARELRGTGLSLRAVGAKLAEAGCLPRSGKAWPRDNRQGAPRAVARLMVRLLGQSRLR